MSNQQLVVHVDMEKGQFTKVPKKYARDVNSAAKVGGITGKGFYLFTIQTSGHDVIASLDGAVHEVSIYIKRVDYAMTKEILNGFGKSIDDEIAFAQMLSDLDEDVEYLHFQTTQFFGADGFSDKRALDNVVEITQVGQGSGTFTANGTSINSIVSDMSTEYGFTRVGAGVPDVIGDGYVLPEELRLIWDWFTSPLVGNSPVPVNMLLLGAKGTGKSDLGLQLAKHIDCEVVLFPMSQPERPQEVFYRRSVSEGNTFDELNSMTEALMRETDAPLIVILDEIDRIPSTEIQNPLLQLLGEQRSCEIGGRTIQYTRPVLFIGTGNSGAGDGYVGTDLLDDALLDRFDIIVAMKQPSEKQFLRVANNHFKGSLPDKDIEKVASIIYSMVNHLMENEMPMKITVRNMLQVLKGMVVSKNTVNMRTAFTFAVLRKLNDSDVLAAMEAIFNSECPL